MFQGYTQGTVDFLWNLRFNNERGWFQEHKEEFLALVDRPTRALAAQLALQAQVSRVVIVIVEGELGPGLSRDGKPFVLLDTVQVADEKHGMNTPRLSSRPLGGEEGPQSRIVLRRDLIMHLACANMFSRHEASSFAEVNITKEKELVMTEI